MGMLTHMAERMLYQCLLSLPTIFIQIGSNRVNPNQPVSERAICTVIPTLHFKHLVGHSNEVA